MSFERDLQMMDPWQREVLRLLSHVTIATTATAVLVLLVGLAIVGLAVGGF